MNNLHGTNTTNVGNGGASSSSSRPLAISTARPTCHRLDYNYRAFHPHDNNNGVDFHNVGVKNLTDQLGGIKFYLGCNVGGNPFGYPHYNQCLSGSPTHFVELSEIPTELWTSFWKDMARAQETGDNHFGFLIVGGFAALVGTVLAAIYFSNALVPAVCLVLVVVVMCCCVSNTYTEWRRVIAKYQPQFQAAGYHVELFIEITGPPSRNHHGSVSPKCYVCHIRKNNNTSHKTSSPTHGTTLT